MLSKDINSTCPCYDNIFCLNKSVHSEKKSEKLISLLLVLWGLRLQSSAPQKKRTNDSFSDSLVTEILHILGWLSSFFVGADWLHPSKFCPVVTAYLGSSQFSSGTRFPLGVLETFLLFEESVIGKVMPEYQSLNHLYRYLVISETVFCPHERFPWSHHSSKMIRQDSNIIASYKSHPPNTVFSLYIPRESAFLCVYTYVRFNSFL